MLCYHAVSDVWPADLALPAAELRRQLKRLIDAGYRARTLSDAAVSPPGERTLVVTFDDAFRSVLTEAAPVLAELDIPGTLYVPSEKVDRDDPMSWDGIDRWLDTEYARELVPMTWAEIRELADTGWEIGSHTCSHPHLPDLDDAALEHELRSSKLTCEARLDRPCPTLAYPYGDTDRRVQQAALAAGYRLAVSLPARWSAHGDPVDIARVGVYHGQSPLVCALKTSPIVRAARVALRR